MSSSGGPSGNNIPSPLRPSNTASPAASAGSPQPRRLSYANVAAGQAGGIYSSRLNPARAAGSTSTHPAAAPAITREVSRGSMDLDMNEDGQDWERGANSGTGARRRKGATDGLNCALHDDHPPFVTPSYLYHSRYVQRLRRQWNDHISELRSHHVDQMLAAREGLGSGVARQLGLDSAAGLVGSGKLPSAYAHRGIVQDVIERFPPPATEDEEKPMSLPSRWSKVDKWPGLEILADGSEVRFDGVTKSSDEAASVRSDYPIPKECGLYYFEVTVLSRGRDGLIGIGFSGRKVGLNRLPGWEPESWAYHGDDGYSFACTASGKAYGPRFSAEDVVGCGVNFRTGSSFFTKNGVYLGVAFNGLKADVLYPSVGMKKPGEHLRVNFGQEPFVYDIDRVMDQERAAILAEINKADATGLHPPDTENDLVHNLIGQYLAHQGFVETAKAFAIDVREQVESLAPIDASNDKSKSFLSNAEDDVHACNRQKIRKAILNGDIDRALKYTNSFYPHVLEDERNRDIYFRLRCRKFIEMMRRYNELQPIPSLTSSGVMPLTRSIESLSSNGHLDPATLQNIGADERPPPQDTQMELDEQLHRETVSPPQTRSGKTAVPTDDVDMANPQTDLSGDVPSSPEKSSFMKQNDLLTAALAYGQELQSSFGADPRPQVKKQLEDVFAIMAYTNPQASVVGGLLHPHGRVAIAEEVNGAILVSLGKPPSAALERLCAQTEWLLDETAAKKGGATALVNAKLDFLRPDIPPDGDRWLEVDSVFR